MLTRLFEALSGNKSYLAGGGLLVVGLFRLCVLHDLAGGLHDAWLALGVVGLRHAIAKGG